jgi:hypothetical protein
MCPVITLNAKAVQYLRPHTELQMTTPQTNPFSLLLLNCMGRNPGTILTTLYEYNVGLPYKRSGLRQKGYKYKSINLWRTRNKG